MKSTSVYDDPRGFVCKLGDFGLSRVLEHNSTHVSTNTYGTPSALSRIVQQACVWVATNIGTGLLQADDHRRVYGLWIEALPVTIA